MLQQAVRHGVKNNSKFVADLSKLVAVPSVSFAGFPPKEVERSARAVANLMRERGLEHVRTLNIPGAHPYVYGDWLRAPGKPTLLLYAHHDVQPPGREHLWRTPPFKATPKNGRLYGRGAADDKAGIIVHTSAVSSYLETAGRLPLNVKVIIEGEEETGSDHLEAFLRKYAGMLKADVIVLTDTGNFDVGLPSITASLRGLVAVDVEVRTMDHPLHSGMWGGPIPDPVIALSKMLSSLVDKDFRIAIPGIYDEVRGLSAKEKRQLGSLPYNERDLRKQTGIFPSTRVVGGKGGFLEKFWHLPSVSVNAIQASTKRDCANIINDTAWCHVGIRTVPDMDSGRTARLLMGHLKKHAPWGARVRFSNLAKNDWWTTDPRGPAFEAAQRALSRGFGRKAVTIGTGGSIGFVDPFSRILGAPALLIGVEDPYTNPHSENESVHLGDLRKSILSAIHLYHEIASLNGALSRKR